MTLVGQFDSHLQTGSQAVEPCVHCHVSTPVDLLFLHEGQNVRLCQDCLAKFLEAEVRDSPDHKGYFEGWIFCHHEHYGYFEAYRESDGEAVLPAKEMGDVLEAVLMKKNYI